MNERYSILLNKPWVIPTSVGVAGFVGGLGLGYILGKRNGDVFEVVIEEDTSVQLELDFDDDGNVVFDTVEQVVKPITLHEVHDISDTEEVLTVVAPIETKIQYDNVIDLDGKIHSGRPDPKDIVVEKTAKVVKSSSKDSREKQKNHGVSNLSKDMYRELEAARVNVFTKKNDDWDYEAELSTRSPNEPYILNQEEYFNDEMGLEQITVTYYAGDDILTDDRDVPIYNHSDTVGELRFGHGSNDPNVVYIRNELKKVEYEVLLHHGRYEVEVLGHQIEEQMEADDLKHSTHYRLQYRFYTE